MHEALTEDQKCAVVDNIKLAYFISNNRRPPSGVDRDDWEQEAMMALCRSVQQHDPERGKLSTLLRSKVMDRHTALRRPKQSKREIKVSDLSGEDDEVPVQSCYPDISFDFVDELLSFAGLFPARWADAIKRSIKSGFVSDSDILIINEIRSGFGHSGKLGLCKSCGDLIVRTAENRAKSFCDDCKIYKDRQWK